MKLVWHILRKDLWHVRFYLLFVAATGVAVYALLLRVVPPLGPEYRRVESSLFVFVYSAVWLSLVPTMLQTDAPMGSAEFWMTRPISKGSIFAAKAIGGLFVLVFVMLGHALFLFTQGFQAAQIVSVIGSVASNLIQVGVFAFLIASLTPRLGHFWFVFLALGLGGMLGLSALASSGFAGQAPRELNQTRWNLWLGLAAIGGLVLVRFQYHHRQSQRGWLAVGALVAAVSLLSRFFPWSVGILQESRFPAASWSLQISNQRLGDRAVTGFPPLLVEATPPVGSVARIGAISGKTVWSDGRKLDAAGAFPGSYTGRIAAVETVLGASYLVADASGKKEAPIEVSLFPRFSAALVGAENLRPTRFDGVLHGEQIRYFLMGKLALTPGASVAREGCKLVVVQSPLVNPADWLVVRYQSVHYRYSDSGVPRRPLLVLVNSTRKEARVLPSHGESEHMALGLPGLDLITIAWNFSARGEKGPGYVPEDNDWLAEAELWVFGEKFEGFASQSFASALISDGSDLIWTKVEPSAVTSVNIQSRAPLHFEQTIETPPSR